jgi:hypothetical protein
MVGLSSECMFGQKQILDFRTRFTQETEAVRRAQKMLKLGEADFDEVTGDIDAVKLPDGLAVLKEYRDEIQLCEEGLDAKKIDAEKHPQGFKQLEISLRQSLPAPEQLTRRSQERRASAFPGSAHRFR